MTPKPKPKARSPFAERAIRRYLTTRDPRELLAQFVHGLGEAGAGTVEALAQGAEALGGMTRGVGPQPDARGLASRVHEHLTGPLREAMDVAYGPATTRAGASSQLLGNVVGGAVGPGELASLAEGGGAAITRAATKRAFRPLSELVQAEGTVPSFVRRGTSIATMQERAGVTTLGESAASRAERAAIDAEMQRIAALPKPATGPSPYIPSQPTAATEPASEHLANAEQIRLLHGAGLLSDAEAGPAIAARTEQANATTDPLEAIMPYLSEAERTRVTANRGTNLRRELRAAIPKLGPDEPLVHAALRGQLAKGGYAEVRPVLEALLGPEDAERFAGLWAAVSPQQPNEKAIAMTLDAFQGWQAAGRPTDPTAIADAIRPHVPGLWGTRGPNAIHALSAPSGTINLSGPKVNSFFPNLMGDLERVTLDTRQGAGQGINPEQFGKVAPYLAGSAQVRRVGQTLGVAPAEAQEMMWSTIRAMAENPGREITPELAGGQWQGLAALLREEPYLSKTSALNPPGELIAPRPRAIQFPTGDPDPLESLSERLKASASGRYLLGTGLLGLGLGASARQSQ